MLAKKPVEVYVSEVLLTGSDGIPWKSIELNKRVSVDKKRKRMTSLWRQFRTGDRLVSGNTFIGGVDLFTGEMSSFNTLDTLYLTVKASIDGANPGVYGFELDYVSKKGLDFIRR